MKLAFSILAAFVVALAAGNAFAHREHGEKSPPAGCNSYGCWEAGGGCNSYGCWKNNGGCNSYGCWNSSAGACNSYGCSELGACNSYGCPKASSVEIRGRERHDEGGEGTLVCREGDRVVHLNAGGANSYGSFEAGGGCNSYGCWKQLGGCNSYGCWNSSVGACNSYGCSDAGECTSYGCPKGGAPRLRCHVEGD